MANIKLTGHTWDTSGIYDAEQEKTQAEVNSELKTALTADETLQPKTTKTVVTGWTSGRITSNALQTNSKYAYSDTYEFIRYQGNLGQEIYFDDTKYELVFCYYDDAVNNPTNGFGSISSYSNSSPVRVPYARDYFRCMLRSANDINVSGISVYWNETGNTLLVDTVLDHEDRIDDLEEASEETIDRVDVLEGKITPITLTDIQNTTTYPRYDGALKEDGDEFSSVSNTHKYIVVPCMSGEIIKMTACDASAGTSLLYAACKSIPAQPTEAHTPIPLSTYAGWTTVKKVKGEKSITEILPPDAKCVLVQVQRSSASWMPTAFYVGLPATIKWMAMGDSITQGMYSMSGDNNDSENSATYNGCYAAWVAFLKDFDLTNKGIGGTGWVKRGGGNSSKKLNAIEQICHRKGIDSGNNAVDVIDFTDEYEDIPFVIDFSGIDLLTVMFGLNDWKGSISSSLPIPHGTIDSVTDPQENYDVAYQTEGDPLSAYNEAFYDGSGINYTETVYGNMKFFLEKVQARNPKMKIVVISPLNSAIYPSNALGGEASTPPSTVDNQYAIGFKYYNGKTLEDMFTLEKNVCELYGIQFVDMLHSSSVNLLNIATALPDKVHPSLDTHQQIAHEIASKIMYQ